MSQPLTCFDGVFSSIRKSLDKLLDLLLGDWPWYRVRSHAAISAKALEWRRDRNIRG